MHLLACLALLVAAPASERVAVLEIAAKAGFSPDQRDIFTELLQHELRTLGHTVIGKSDIEATLGFDRMKASIGCDTSACLAEIGGALGANEIITGAIARLSPYVIITLKRIDPKTSTVRKQVVRKIEGEGQKELVDAVQPIVAELYGAAPPATTAPIVAGSGDNELRIHTDDTRMFDVTVTAGGKTFACPGPVTRNRPCEMRLPAGRAHIIVAGFFEDDVQMHGSTRTDYQVRYRTKNLYWVPGTLTAVTAGFAVMAGIGARNQDRVLTFIGGSFTGIFGATALTMWIVTPIIAGNASKTRYEAIGRPTLNVTPMPGGLFANAGWTF